MTIDAWQSLLDDDTAAGLSQSSIRNESILIKAIVLYALKRDIISKNIYEFLEIPVVGPKHKTSLEFESLILLITPVIPA